jgi:hypothetical protein
MKTLSVGLLSRKLSRRRNTRTMWQAVVEVLEHHEDLDLLVCDGFTTSRYGQLGKIVERSRSSKTLIVCELNRSGRKVGTPTGKKGKKKSRLYWVYAGEKVSVAAQAFFDSAGTLREAKRAVSAWRDRLEKQPGSLPPSPARGGDCGQPDARPHAATTSQRRHRKEVKPACARAKILCASVQLEHHEEAKSEARYHVVAQGIDRRHQQESECAAWVHEW